MCSPEPWAVCESVQNSELNNQKHVIKHAEVDRESNVFHRYIINKTQIKLDPLSNPVGFLTSL